MGTESALLVGFLAGLFGSTHCLAMCGGISAMLHSQMRPGHGTGWLALGFQLGRGLSYLALGAVLAVVGLLPTWLLPAGAGSLARWLLGALVVSIGFAMLGRDHWAEKLGRFSQPVTQRVQPCLRRLLPVRHPHQAVIAGLLWGLIPCGLLYSVLAAAMLQADLVRSTALLAAFWAGTLPALMLGGMAAFRLRLGLANRTLRRTAGVMVVLTGLLVAAGPALASHLHHAGLRWLVDCVTS